MRCVFVLMMMLSALTSARETRYNTMITTFHPEGRLVQLEHAQAAADRGLPVLAVTLPNSAGVLVITSMGSVRPKLLELNIPAGLKCARLDPEGRLALAFSGVAVDGVSLVKAARAFVADELVAGNDHPTPMEVARHLAQKAHEATIAVSQRPLGASVLVVGSQRDIEGVEPEIVSVQPSGLLERWRACAIGVGAQKVMALLGERSDDLLVDGIDDMSLRRFVGTCLEAVKVARELPSALEVHFIGTGVNEGRKSVRIVPSEEYGDLETVLCNFLQSNLSSESGT